MEKYFLFVIAFGVLVCNNIRLADQCKTHADCPSYYLPYCCGGYLSFGSKGRTCTSGSCLGRYCSSDSDCGDPSMCCRFNTCVNKGCSGCTNNTDCYSSHVCCKKTFPFGQTVCAANCVGQTCNSNDDCGRWNECCRSGKCTNNYTACRDKCTSNSECNLDQYCCMHKERSYWEDNCAKSCVGEFCRIDDDCGARNVCCISNKCVDRGCSGCTSNTDCSTGQYCCKNRQSFSGKFSVCSAHCIGRSCSTSDDCGGPGETCNSDRKCAVNQNSNPTLPLWLIAVITANLVVFLIAVGIFLAVFRYVKKRRPVNATQTVAVPLQDTPRRKAQVHQNQQTNAQFSYGNNETDHSQHDNKNVARPSHYASHQHQRFQNGPQATSSQGHVTQNAGKSPQQANENHGFRRSLPPIYKNHTAQSDEVHQDHNQVRQPVYHTLASPETTKDVPIRNNSGHKIYPQNTALQDKDYNVIHPPYNPMYQSKR